jgi:hypothetical protein
MVSTSSNTRCQSKTPKLVGLGQTLRFSMKMKLKNKMSKARNAYVVLPLNKFKKKGKDL